MRQRTASAMRQRRGGERGRFRLRRGRPRRRGGWCGLRTVGHLRVLASWRAAASGSERGADGGDDRDAVHACGAHRGGVGEADPADGDGGQGRDADQRSEPVDAQRGIVVGLGACGVDRADAEIIDHARRHGCEFLRRAGGEADDRIRPHLLANDAGIGVVLPDMHAIRPDPARDLDAIVDDEGNAQRAQQGKQGPGLIRETMLVRRLVAELHQRDAAAHGRIDESHEVAAAQEHRVGDEIK